jgi:hypothetical protein
MKSTLQDYCLCGEIGGRAFELHGTDVSGASIFSIHTGGSLGELQNGLFVYAYGRGGATAYTSCRFRFVSSTSEWRIEARKGTASPSAEYPVQLSAGSALNGQFRCEAEDPAGVGDVTMKKGDLDVSGGNIICSSPVYSIESLQRVYAYKTFIGSDDYTYLHENKLATSKTGGGAKTFFFNFENATDVTWNFRGDLLVDNATDFQQGNRRKIQTVTDTTLTLTGIESTVLMESTAIGTPVTITLDASGGTAGQIYNIKCIDDTGVCTINPNGANIDGVAGNLILIQDESVTIQTDGTNWWIV